MCFLKNQLTDGGRQLHRPRIRGGERLLLILVGEVAVVFVDRLL